MITPLEIVKKKKEEAIDRIMSKGYLTKKRVYVGMATCEIAAGSKDAMAVFQTAKEKGLNIFISQKGCAGRCNLEPTVEVVEEGKAPVKYGKVTKEVAQKIVDQHLKKDEIVKEAVIN